MTPGEDVRPFCEIMGNRFAVIGRYGAASSLGRRGRFAFRGQGPLQVSAHNVRSVAYFGTIL